MGHCFAYSSNTMMMLLFASDDDYVELLL